MNAVGYAGLLKTTSKSSLLNCHQFLANPLESAFSTFCIKLHLVQDKLSSLLGTDAPLGPAASTRIHRAPRGGRKKLAKGHKTL